MPAKIMYLENRSELKELLKKETNVIVKASAGWCGPCKMITPYFDDFVENYYNNRIVVVKLDVDVGRDLATFLKVQSIPQIFYFKDSQLQTTILGADMGQLRKFLETILKDL